MSLWWAWKHQAWSPSGCPARYATDTYTFQGESDDKCSALDHEQQPCISTANDHHSKSDNQDSSHLWCPACMRMACEPITLKCGHSFCRRCLAQSRRLLESEHQEVLLDGRSSMFCPLTGCHNHTCRERFPCLPFINGDFRFKEIRPDEKVQQKVPLAASFDKVDDDMLSYKVEVDHDVTLRRSDWLFHDES